jgi:hypothetical protein
MVVLALLVGAGYGANPLAEALKQPAAPPPAAAAAETAVVTNLAPRIVCDEPEFDFGTRKETEVVEHRFVIKNEGEAPLNITRVRASCGCTATSVGEKLVPTGGVTHVEAKFTLRGRHGDQRKGITVESDDPKTPQMRLWLKGKVTTEVAFDPRYVSFGRLQKDEVAERKVKLVSRLPDVKITEVTTPSKSFVVTLDEGGRGITIKTVPPMKPGPVRAMISAQTDHPDKIKLSLHAVGSVVGPLTVVPREIVLRSSQTNVLRRTVLVRPGSVKTFELNAIEVPDGVTFESKALAGNTHSISLDGLLATKEFNGKEIVVRTDATNMPVVRVPIRVIP